MAPKPTKPASYGGAKIMACIGDSVYFVDGTRISVGEESNGLRVISANPPWEVTVSHGGWDWVVSMLPDSTESFFGGSLAQFGTSNPGMESAPRATPPAETASPSAPAVPSAGASPPVVTHPDGRTLPAPDPAEGEAPPESEGGSTDNDPASAPEAQGAPNAPETAGATGAAGAPSAPDLPPVLTKAQVEQMDRATAQLAISAVTRARLNRSLDEQTRARLNQEYVWLQQQMKKLPR